MTIISYNNKSKLPGLVIQTSFHVNGFLMVRGAGTHARTHAHTHTHTHTRTHAYRRPHHINIKKPGARRPVIIDNIESYYNEERRIVYNSSNPEIELDKAITDTPPFVMYHLSKPANS